MRLIIPLITAVDGFTLGLESITGALDFNVISGNLFAGLLLEDLVIICFVWLIVRPYEPDLLEKDLLSYLSDDDAECGG